MTQGFDEWMNKKTPYGNVSIRQAFEAGAASRQAEIDELKRELEILQGMHNALSLTAWDFVGERDELQKRIDDALDYVFGLYCTGDLDTERLENILKGESNE